MALRVETGLLNPDTAQYAGTGRVVASIADVAATARKIEELPQLPKFRFFLLSRVSRKKADRLMNQTSFDENSLHVCSRCVSACPG